MGWGGLGGLPREPSCGVWEDEQMDYVWWTCSCGRLYSPYSLFCGIPAMRLLFFFAFLSTIHVFSFSDLYPLCLVRTNVSLPSPCPIISAMSAHGFGFVHDGLLSRTAWRAVGVPSAIHTLSSRTSVLFSCYIH